MSAEAPPARNRIVEADYARMVSAMEHGLLRIQNEITQLTIMVRLAKANTATKLEPPHTTIESK